MHFDERTFVELQQGVRWLWVQEGVVPVVWPDRAEAVSGIQPESAF